MNQPIITEAVITSDHRLSLNLELPKDYPTGAALVTVTVKAKKDANIRPNRAAEAFGRGKGLVWMSDDFDAPLDDFAEYM
jgi:hypothetical protein